MQPMQCGTPLLRPQLHPQAHPRLPAQARFSVHSLCGWVCAGQWRMSAPHRPLRHYFSGGRVRGLPGGVNPSERVLPALGSSVLLRLPERQRVRAVYGRLLPCAGWQVSARSAWMSEVLAGQVSGLPSLILVNSSRIRDRWLSQLHRYWMQQVPGWIDY